MAALRSRCGDSILQLWFVSVFLAYSQRSQTGCLPYFHTWCGLSVNLECRSEMCCTRLAENTGRINRHLCTIPQFCQAISPQLRHMSTIEKNLLNSNISSTFSHNMVNIGLLTAEIGWRVWGTPANFNGFRVLASLLHRCRSTEGNQTLHDVWPSPGLVHYAVNHKKRGSLFLTITLANLNRFYSFYIILIVKKFYMRLY